MNTLKIILEFLIWLAEIILMVGLIASGGISFSANAKEPGGIVVFREVPQRSAIRPSLAPGQSFFVDTSPDDKVINAVGSNDLPTSLTPLNQLTELDEKAFSKISSNTPQSFQPNINTHDIVSQIKGKGSSNFIQSTQRLNSILVNTGGASMTNSIRRATSSIGRSINGATGFLSAH